MKSAFETEMNEIHAMLARKMKEILEKGEQVVVGDQVLTARPSAATMNAIRAFLKDNNIMCDKGHATRPVGELSASMEKLLDETPPEDLPKFTN